MLKQQNFFDRNIPAWKQVLFLSWPTIVELLLQTAVNYVDTAMVGSIGVNATAAVSITMSTIWLINGFMNAVGIGYSVLAAHSIGEGNYEQAKVIIRQSILAIGVAGIFLTLIVTLFIAPNLPAWMHAEKEVVPLARSYLRIIGMGYLFNISLIVCSNLLRCAGDTKTPMKFNILTNIINVVGNYLLIYPSKEIQLFGKNFLLQRAGLGVSGAAAATSMSIAFSGIGLLLILFLRQTPYQISLKEDFFSGQFYYSAGNSPGCTDCNGAHDNIVWPNCSDLDNYRTRNNGTVGKSFSGYGGKDLLSASLWLCNGRNNAGGTVAGRGGKRPCPALRTLV